MINSLQKIKGENKYGSRTVYNKKKKREHLKLIGKNIYKRNCLKDEYKYNFYIIF